MAEQINSQLTPAASSPGTDLQSFRQNSNAILDLLARYQAKLSPRDIAMLHLGMRASHIEEAVASGEIDRARSHLKNVLDLLQNLPAAPH